MVRRLLLCVLATVVATTFLVAPAEAKPPRAGGAPGGGPHAGPPGKPPGQHGDRGNGGATPCYQSSNFAPDMALTGTLTQAGNLTFYGSFDGTCTGTYGGGVFQYQTVVVAGDSGSAYALCTSLISGFYGHADPTLVWGYVTPADWYLCVYGD